MSARALMVVLLLGCAEGEAPAAASAPLEGSLADGLGVPASAPSDARALLFAGLRERRGAAALFGAREGTHPWETRVRPRRGEAAADARARGGTFVRRRLGEAPSALELAFRLGAGDRGAHMGGVVGTGAERAMAELRVSDPLALQARFALRLFATNARGRLEDVTPSYLRRPTGRGVVRAWLDVPPPGGRALFHVDVLRRGERIAEGYTSPIAVERPWLR
ncbi:MAG: hypothetical protein AAGH15_24590 [Myxococcota bacterium]